MRVFLYEYTCAAQANLTDADCLHAQGHAMLSALQEDFSRLPDVTVLTLIDAPDEEAAFRALARSADFSLVVAPEIDDILLTRCRWVLESGGQLLGPDPEPVGLTGDKLLLARYLHARGVATPECLSLPAGQVPPFFPAVWKPRFGAGSLATFLIRTPHEWPRAFAAAATEGCVGERLWQRFVPGQAVSVSFLVDPRSAPASLSPLLPGDQLLSSDGRFHYLGGRIPISSDRSTRAVSLARKALTCIPGLRGYVGVDVVLGDEADGSQDWVIEINPRLTTSYVGLRALCESNLAQAMLAFATGQEMPVLSWRQGRVTFQADGKIRLES